MKIIKIFIAINIFYCLINLAFASEVETNFINLNIQDFQVSHNKSQIVIASTNNKNELYFSDRALNFIKKIRFVKEKKRFEELQQESIPNLIENAITAKTFILDLHHALNGKLYISVFYYFENKNSCSKVMIYEYAADLKNSKIIFSSSPCINIESGFHEISGRLASDKNNIYISGGNILMDIYNIKYPRSDICCIKFKTYEDAIGNTNLYGSVTKISLINNKFEKLTLGHRVPEGLFFSQNLNKLFETEHGPRGGDEINIIEKNANYGWPYETLGRDYDNFDKKYFKTNFNSSNKFTPPYFAFTPSIGISQLNEISYDHSFTEWRGDLILSSLKDKSLYRLKLKKNREIMYVEKILIGKRIRDIDIDNENIYASTDSGEIISISKSSRTVVGDYPKSDYDWSRCAIDRNSIECKYKLTESKNMLGQIKVKALNMLKDIAN